MHIALSKFICCLLRKLLVLQQTFCWTALTTLLQKWIVFRVTPKSDTASEEEDFDSAAKDVSFQPGETGPKSVVIGIVDDSVDEPMEKFSVGLSSNSRAILGGPSSVNIQDNDGKYREYIEIIVKKKENAWLLHSMQLPSAMLVPKIIFDAGNCKMSRHFWIIIFFVPITKNRYCYMFVADDERLPY